jgi:hypothetical protein
MSGETVSSVWALPILGPSDIGTFYTVAAGGRPVEYVWTGKKWATPAEWDRLLPPSKEYPVNVRDEIIDTAKGLISGDRHNTYGDASDDFTRTGKMWEQVLGVEVSPEQVALCMLLVKVSRLTNTHTHRDSWVDVIGYAALGGEIADGR